MAREPAIQTATTRGVNAFRSAVPYTVDTFGSGGGGGGGGGSFAMSSAGMKQMEREGLQRQADYKQRIQMDQDRRWLQEDRGWMREDRENQQRMAESLWGGSGEDGGGGSLARLVEGYNTAYGAARSANEARYQEMLGIADQTTGQRMSDVESDYQQQSSNAMQQLARLGMSNTTVAPTLQMGFDREKQSALNRTADAMQGTRLGIMERKEDAYPDRGSIQAILAGVGNALPNNQGLAPMLSAFANLRQG